MRPLSLLLLLLLFPQCGSQGGATRELSSSSRTYRLPVGVERVVAIGDLHGDFQATLKVFALTGATDESGHWKGGRLHVVQLGDILDRGGEELKIIAFLQRIQKEALAQGGRLYVLTGNHEIVNFQGNFKWADPGSLSTFDRFKTPTLLNTHRTRLRGTKAPYFGRRIAFLPGGPLSSWFAKNPVVLKLGGLLFAHGGVLKVHVNYGLERINRETADYLLGKRTLPPPLVGRSAPIWTRKFAKREKPSRCRKLWRVLNASKTQVLIVGHTVQRGGITSACDGGVYRVDVGMAKKYGTGNIQALEITKRGIRALKPTTRFAHPVLGRIEEGKRGWDTRAKKERPPWQINRN